jgi:hypothetical protein
VKLRNDDDGYVSGNQTIFHRGGAVFAVTEF